MVNQLMWPVIGRYRTYPDAQRAVDFLSDNKFAVENLAIIGADLRQVEQVTGRLNYGRAAALGVGSGAWMGLYVGLLIGLFAGSGSSVLAIVLIGAGYGALFGAVLGVVTYAMTGGRRDFTSKRSVVAAEYLVSCNLEHVDEAAAALAKLPAQA